MAVDKRESRPPETMGVGLEDTGVPRAVWCTLDDYAMALVNIFCTLDADPGDKDNHTHSEGSKEKVWKPGHRDGKEFPKPRKATYEMGKKFPITWDPPAPKMSVFLPNSMTDTEEPFPLAKFE